MKKNKILIITTCFAPENAIGAIRMVKLVKFLVHEGYQITVISPELHSSSKIDRSSECAELLEITRYTVSQSNWFNKYLLKRRNDAISKDSASNLIKSQKQGVISKFKIVTVRLFHLIYTLIRNKDWSRQVTLFISDNDIRNYDFVFSSYPSLGAHWASRRFARQNKSTKWIVDFRDPVNYEMNNTWIGYRLYSFIQRNIVRNANFVIGISKGVLLKVLNGLRTSNALIYNGFDYADLPSVEVMVSDFSVLSFSYVGSLYGGERNIKVVFSVIKTLIDESSATINQFQFNYAGTEFNVLEKMAATAGLEGILINHGFVTRQQSIEIQINADIAVVSTWNTKKEQGVLSGKIFECFMLKKPVVVVINGDLAGSELKQIIDDVSAGFAIEDASPDYNSEKQKLKEFILTSLNEKLLKGQVTASYNNKVEQFDYKNIVSKFAQKIDNL